MKIEENVYRTIWFNENKQVVQVIEGRALI